MVDIIDIDGFRDYVLQDFDNSLDDNAVNEWYEEYVEFINICERVFWLVCDYNDFLSDGNEEECARMAYEIAVITTNEAYFNTVQLFDDIDVMNLAQRFIEMKGTVEFYKKTGIKNRDSYMFQEFYNRYLRGY